MKRAKVIVMTGGGSGGHLTPIIAVAQQLRQQAPDFKLVYIGQTGDKLGDIMTDNPLFDSVYTVRAGKFRRYHGEGLRQFLDVKTLYLNIRDALFVIVGFVQAFSLLGKLQPRVVFCKGGFVGVPVGLASAVRQIPYVTHDSDAIPGLANRIIARWATHHAVAMPKEQYKSYPPHKTVTVGVPLQSSFRRVTDTIKTNAREKLGIAKKSWVVLVIGGGLGANKVNKAVIGAAKDLYKNIPNLYILHVAGRNGEEEVRGAYEAIKTIDDKSYSVFGFTDKVALLGEAADVVITRAGATNLAEFSVQGKACIIVPNPVLTGGHQVKNAQVYADAKAALVLAEQNLELLSDMLVKLHSDKATQTQLGEAITQFSNKQAAQMLAGILLTTASKE